MRPRLREERLKRGMSYRDVAEAIGLTERAVRYIEAGERKPSLDTALKLEALFGISPRELLVQEDSTVEAEVKQA